jgi:60 kDa SS-A/Ro ribonucleoprotein
LRQFAGQRHPGGVARERRPEKFVQTAAQEGLQERPVDGLASVDPTLALADAASAARTASLDETLRLVADHRLPWEAVRSEHLAAPQLWDTLLDGGLPLTALVRNLARMSACGLLTAGSSAERRVVARLGDGEALRRSRVHPLALLTALVTYARGTGVRGNLHWTPTKAVRAALDGAFYAAFPNVRSTGLRWRLALDVSGSMACGELSGFPGISPRVGSAAMAMVTAAREPTMDAVAFTAAGGGYGGKWGGGDAGLTDVSMRHRTLDALVAATAALPMGGTDCALPILDAHKRRLAFDVFVVYTDSETWHGTVHPAEALDRYRQATGIAAKLIVVGMVANPFTIARPGDPGMLDVVGFDTGAPDAMAAFAAPGTEP